MRSWLLLVPILTLVGCGASPREELEPPSIVSGSRFVARYVEDESGGARRFLHFVDLETGQPCRLQNSANGSLQISCTPEPSAMLYFIDEQCTQEALQTTEPEREWFTVIGTESHGPSRIGAAISVTERYHKVGDLCVSAGPPAGADLYEVAEVLPAEDFVLGELQTEALPEGVDAIWITGLDGVRALHHLEDSLVGTTCRVAETEAGPRCASALGQVEDEGLRDPECQRLAVVTYGALKIARVTQRDDAVYRFTLASYESPLGQEGEDGTCEVVESRFGRMTPYLGDPYPADLWPVIERPAVGGPRLRSRPGRLSTGMSAAGVGDVDFRTLFEDAQSNLDCGPAWVDGSLRCAPAPTEYVRSYRTVFEDGDCQRRAVAVTAGAPPPELLTVYEGSGEAGLPLATVRRRGRKLDVAYRYGRESSCQSTDTGEDHYALDGPVAADTLAPLRLASDQPASSR